ncbi:MAG: hypothetical protein Q8P39_01465 [Candidatus Yanofskybacteria bacterium]|nr:hypothetical protein [Candidatus Yanofskybacteria bacterium]
MKNLQKQDIRQWGKQLGEALWFLGEHAFVATLLFVLGAGLIAAFLFWQYVIFSPQVEQNEIVSEFEFQEEVFEGLLSDLKEQKAKVQQADFLSPRDLFNP